MLTRKFLCLLLLPGFVLLAAPSESWARKQYMEQFKLLYPKLAEKENITCATCHPNKKTKRQRNAYATELQKHVGKKNQRDTDAIVEALKKVAAKPSTIPGKTFAALIAEGIPPDGFRSIFNGESLEGWDGDPKLWNVEDGAITGTTTDDAPIPANTFLIWKAGKVADFELQLEYRIVNGNSGIQYRSFMLPDGGKWAVGGYQADFEAGKRFSGILYGEKFRGILANRGLKTELHRTDGKFEVRRVGTVGKSDEIQAKILHEDWNQYHISARGFHFVHRINGVITCECTDLDEKMRRADGIVALQLHRGPAMKVQFRNIRLKVLPPQAAGKQEQKKAAGAK